MLDLTEEQRNHLMSLRNPEHENYTRFTMKVWMLANLHDDRVHEYYTECMDHLKIRLRQILHHNGTTWPPEITPPNDPTHVTIIHLSDQLFFI